MRMKKCPCQARKEKGIGFQYFLTDREDIWATDGCIYGRITLTWFENKHIDLTRGGMPSNTEYKEISKDKVKKLLEKKKKESSCEKS